MKNKFKIQINVNLEKLIDNRDKFLSEGFSDRNKETIVKDLLEKSFNKNKSYSGSNIKIKIKKLILNFNEHNEKTMIVLDTSKKSFRNAIKSINEGIANQFKYQNTCFMAKTRSSETICLFGDLILLKKNDDYGKNIVSIHFELMRIDFFNFKNIKTNKTIELNNFEFVNDLPKTFSSYEDFLNHIVNKGNFQLANLWDEETPLEFKKWDNFLWSFKSFLNDNKKNESSLELNLEWDESYENVKKITPFKEKHKVYELNFVGTVKKDEKVYINKGSKTKLFNHFLNLNYSGIIKQIYKEKDFINNLIDLNKKDNDDNNLRDNRLLQSNDELNSEIDKKSKIGVEKTKIITIKSSITKEIKSTEEKIKNEIYEIKLKIDKEDFKIFEFQKLMKEKKEFISLIKNKNSKKNRKTNNVNGNSKNIVDYLKEIENLEKEIRKINENFKNIEILKINLKSKIEKFKFELKSKNLIFKKSLDEKDGEIRTLKNKEKVFSRQIEFLEIEKKELEEEIININSKIKSRSEKIKFLKENDLYKIKLALKADTITESGNNNPEFNVHKEGFMDKEKEWKISTFDYGLFSQINRYLNAMIDIKKGYYKNPFLVTSLENPSKIEVLSEECNFKYKLNKEQQKAFNKAISTNDVFYLQGPPGTGKTQTITSIASYITSEKENKNVVISSSTHEAIDNFFDRLDENEISNPNIFLLRYTYNKRKEKKQDYSEEDVYPRFLKSINKFIFGKNEVFDFEKISTNFPKNVSIWDRRVFDYHFKKTKNGPKSQMELKEFYNLDDDLNYDEILEGIETEFKKFERRKKAKEPKILTYIEDIVDEIFYNNLMDKLDIKDFADIEVFKNKMERINDEINNKRNKNKFSSLINKYDKKINLIEPNYFAKEESSFKNYLIQNQLINVIGITTSARKSFEFHKKTQELFRDYPIDYLIVDEVSKSITPEILSNSLLSKKIILAGDYRQLPPEMKIDESLLEKFIDSNHTKESNDWKTLDDIKNYVENMSKKSLFKNQIQTIKRNRNTTNYSYEYLKEQFRFTKNIMELVNISYDYEENLTFPSQHKNKKWSKYKIRNKDKNYTNDINIIDSSFINEDFAKECINNGLLVEHNDISFDQTTSFLKKKEFGGSRINDYHAFILKKLLIDIKKNPNIENENIGIIAMTRSQANNLKNIFKDIKEFNGIKVDTVDNFQGREKDLIIVDFVVGQNKLVGKKINKSNTRNVSFYKSTERINVAISRAKSKLILLGAFEGYMNDGIISALEKDGKVENINFMREIYNIVKKKAGVIKIW